MMEALMDCMVWASTQLQTGSRNQSVCPFCPCCPVLLHALLGFHLLMFSAWCASPTCVLPFCPVWFFFPTAHSVLFSSLPLSFGLTVEGLCRLRAFRLTWIKYNPDLPANLQHNHTLFCGYVFVWGRLRALAATDTLFVLLYTVSNPFIPPTLNWTCWNYW